MTEHPLVVEWRAKMQACYEEADRIDRTIKEPTGASDRCRARAAVWCEAIKSVSSELARLNGEVGRLRVIADAAEEVLEVADARGDTDLPHPAAAAESGDPRHWTARMQTAWDELRATLSKGADDGR